MPMLTVTCISCPSITCGARMARRIFSATPTVSCMFFGAREQDDELVATQTTDDIRAAHASDQALADRLQQMVADRVAM